MANKLGVHALVWVGGWTHAEAEKAILQSAELGFDLIEIPALDPSTIDAPFTRKLLERHGLGCTVSLGLDSSTDISSGNPVKIKAGQARLQHALNVAAELQATHLCGVLYSALAKYFEPPTEAGISGAIDTLRAIADSAASHGITLGLEVVNRYETNVLNTAAQAVAFVSRIGARNVKVHLDTYHMNIEEADIEKALIDTGDMLGYFHIGESGRGYLGAGNVDFRSVFRGLAKIRYAGPITFESFSSAVVNPQLSGLLAIWRNLWDDGGDLANHAKEFIQANLKSALETEARAGKVC
jgi:D-psicose/D-tagatose/L-ribulose 3-epimerase